MPLDAGTVWIAVVAVGVPALAALILGLSGKRMWAKRAALVAGAACVVSGGFLLLDAVLGFQRMVAVYVGLGLALIVGGILGRLLRSVSS